MSAPKNNDEQNIKPLNVHVTDTTDDGETTPEDKIRNKKGIKDAKDGDTDFTTDNVHVTSEPVH